ncbi:MAG: glycine--tRNA ligase subunit beta [Candidatus Brocadiaceae bacterium]|nr:glycine--tRNA ligase subunit beta [Candidatus Brocadiaceae bacterium]
MSRSISVQLLFFLLQSADYQITILPNIYKHILYRKQREKRRDTLYDSNMTNLLFEIGTEEIPASYITPALHQIEKLFADHIKKHRLTLRTLYCTGTPRRLTLFVEGLPQEQTGVTEEIQGPSAAIAFDREGNLTKAGIGFAKSQNIRNEELQVKKTTKGEYCFANKRIEGQDTLRVLSNILPVIVKHISFPKSMKWKGNDLFFARPIRSLLALFGKEVVPMEVNGVKADRYTFGHPFLSGKKIEITEADWDIYKQSLKQEKVCVDMKERRETLEAKISQLMTPFGATIDDRELLDEVTNLVEYPNVIQCGFDGDFLDIPAKVIETAMKNHQRYFPIKKQDGTMTENFIVVLNRDENNADTTRQGNERVLRARLSDARFFWKEDRKVSLAKRVEDLKNLVFLEKMGSYLDRTNRIVHLSNYLSHKLIDESTLAIEDVAAVKRAALLCKTDLLTQMVGEFPSLQGDMGREYAEWDGEEPPVALAIAEHYMPRFATDAIPASKIGAIVGLADKFDTISSCFALQLTPTGSQDPYSLRRHAYGIIRIIMEHGFPLELKEVLEKSLSLLPLFSEKQEHDQAKTIRTLVSKIRDFFRDRLFQIQIEKGIRHDLVNAVLNAGVGFDDICNFFQRLEAISFVSRETWWPELVSTVERTYNIGKKAKSSGTVNENLLSEPEENQLWNVYKQNEATVRKQIDEKRYQEASYSYYDIFSRPVHTFFDKVFVNVEDEKKRNNRLVLLKEINALYSLKIADLSQIVMPENKTP